MKLRTAAVALASALLHLCTLPALAEQNPLQASENSSAFTAAHATQKFDWDNIAKFEINPAFRTLASNSYGTSCSSIANPYPYQWCVDATTRQVYLNTQPAGGGAFAWRTAFSLNADGTLNQASIADGSISGRMLAPGAVTANIGFTPVQSVAGRGGNVSLSAGDVSGLAASATTDTTNAGNISSGTFASGRLPTFVQSGTGAVARTIFNKLSDHVSVTDFGAKCDNSTDDTTSIQAAVNYISTNRGGRVEFPFGTCAISAAITVPASKTVLFNGTGVGNTILRQTTATADGIVFANTDFTTMGGGVSNMSIEAGTGWHAAGFAGTGSTGRGIVAQHMNNGWGVNHVDISNFDTGISYLSSWNTNSTDINIRYFAADAIFVGSAPGGAVAGGNKIIQGAITNVSFAGTNTAAHGIRVRASGGDFFSKLDITGVFNGVLVDPVVSDSVNYLWLDAVLADTSAGDGMIFDGTNGSIYAARLTDTWSSFNTGNGLVTKGPNLHGLRAKGMAMRENGQRGWLHQGGDGIAFVTPEINHNSRTTNNAFPGVEIATGAGNFQINGGTIGNIESGAANTQSNALLFAGTSANNHVVGVDMRSPGAGQSIVSFVDGNIINSVFADNLPRTTFGVNAAERRDLSVAGFLAAGGTTYLVPSGVNASPGQLSFVAGGPGLIAKAYIEVGTPPGAGQTFTYQVYKNSVAIGATGVISGAASFTVTWYPAVTIAAGDKYELQVLDSAGAAASIHRGYLTLEP